MSDATDVLQAIDQLRRDLSGYHDQLMAHNDLQRHCERQKEQLAALQAIHKPIKDERNLYKRQADKLAAENAKLRELVRDMWQFTGAACKKYPRLFDPAAQGGQMVQPNAIDAFEQRMRELGVEVDA